MTRIGVLLPSFGTAGAESVAACARHAEECGLESVWKGDHLVASVPLLDTTMLLTAAATATERVKVGFGVMVLALRPVVWAAKQVASLVHLSGDRVLLGVGSGGSAHGETAWRAVGVPYAERGRRTDEALGLLPDLVAGKPTVVAGEEVALAPPATMPPVLVGGGGAAAFRRAARFGDEWYPAMTSVLQVREGRRRIAELAEQYGRPTPGVTVSVSTGLGDLPSDVVEGQVRNLTGYFGHEDRTREALALGGPERVAERYAAYAEAGAGRVVAMPFGGDWFTQVELLGEVARLLR